MAEIPFKLTVRDGGELADLLIGTGKATLTASGVSSLIRALAISRFRMLPEVQPDAPTKIDSASEPRFEVKGAGARGGAFIGFRHSGYGWLHFHLSHKSLDLLSKGLAQALLQNPPPERLQ